MTPKVGELGLVVVRFKLSVQVMRFQPTDLCRSSIYYMWVFRRVCMWTHITFSFAVNLGCAEALGD